MSKITVKVRNTGGDTERVFDRSFAHILSAGVLEVCKDSKQGPYPGDLIRVLYATGSWIAAIEEAE